MTPSASSIAVSHKKSYSKQMMAVNTVHEQTFPNTEQDKKAVDYILNLFKRHKIVIADNFKSPISLHTRCKDGTNLVYWLGVCDLLRKLPVELLPIIKPFMSIPDNFGHTPLWAGINLAAQVDEGESGPGPNTIPACLFTKHALTMVDSNGETPLLVAVKNGALCMIPSEMLTPEVILAPTKEGKTLLHFIAQHGGLSYISMPLTNEMVTQQDKSGCTPLHIAALNGNLKFFPKELLTLENLSQTDNCGETVFHLAALSGTLGQLPAKLLTNATLLGRNVVGETCIHKAANQQSNYLFKEVTHPAGAKPLDLIPKEFLTCENLLLPDYTGVTPIDGATKVGQLNALLGIELPESLHKIVGDEWWQHNERILKAKKQLSGTVEEPDLDIF